MKGTDTGSAASFVNLLGMSNDDLLTSKDLQKNRNLCFSDKAKE